MNRNILFALLMIVVRPAFSALVIEGRTVFSGGKANPITIIVGEGQILSDMTDPSSNERLSLIYQVPWETLHMVNIKQEVSIDVPMPRPDSNASADFIQDVGRKETVGHWECQVYRYVSKRWIEEVCLTALSTLEITDKEGNTLPYLRSVLENGWAKDLQSRALAIALIDKKLNKYIPVRITKFPNGPFVGPVIKVWEFEVQSIREKSVETGIFNLPANFKHIDPTKNRVGSSHQEKLVS